MATHKMRPVFVDAVQWFKHDDHPDVQSLFKEGQLGEICPDCGKFGRTHGWIPSLEEGGFLCPGDWVVSGEDGVSIPCRAALFDSMYEPIDDSPEDSDANLVPVGVSDAKNSA